MRILFVSDANGWDGFKSVVDKVKADVVLFGGDLVSEGTAEFWDKALYSIPEFRSELLRFFEAHRSAILRKTYSEDRVIFDTIKQHILVGQIEAPVDGSYFHAPDPIMAIRMLFHRRQGHHRTFNIFMNSLTERARKPIAVLASACIFGGVGLGIVLGLVVCV